MLTLAAVLITSGIAAHAAVEKKDVDIKAPDGVNLKGTYVSPGVPGPGMLLLHQCNMNRRAWDGLANDLASAGIHVLSIDHRASGESGGERSEDQAAQRAAREKWPADVDAAYDFLLSQTGVDKTRVAAGGASCGVGQSSLLASRRPEIKTLMLLSGTVREPAMSYIANTPGVAIFGAAAEDDDNAPTIRAVLGVSKNQQNVLKIYPGAEHGVPMFDKNPELQPMIVDWLKKQLRIKAGT
jgi:dienelactone hydrolase